MAVLDKRAQADINQTIGELQSIIAMTPQWCARLMRVPDVTGDAARQQQLTVDAHDLAELPPQFFLG
jgi:hypothetical protein